MAKENVLPLGQTDTAVKEKLKKPDMFKVVMLNDDFTPMDFVIEVVCKVFRKNAEEATAIMLSVHKTGSAVCGIYTYEIAETKVLEVINRARKAGHPLQCLIEIA